MPSRRHTLSKFDPKRQLQTSDLFARDALCCLPNPTDRIRFGRSRNTGDKWRPGPEFEARVYTGRRLALFRSLSDNLLYSLDPLLVFRERTGRRSRKRVGPSIERSRQPFN